MRPHEKARVARDRQHPKVTRSDAAAMMREATNIDAITADIVRNIEEGRTDKWLNTYIEWESAAFGIPLGWFYDGLATPFRSKSPTAVVREAVTPYEVRHVAHLSVWAGQVQGDPPDCHFRSTTNYTAVPSGIVNGPDDDFVAFKVFGFALGERMPHGSVVVVHRDTAPPDNCLVAVQYPGGYAAIRGLRVANDFRLYDLRDPVSMKDKANADAFVGAVVCIIRPYTAPTDDPQASDCNVAWNDGRPLPFVNLGWSDLPTS